jgi:alcohol dehydrogenase
MGPPLSKVMKLTKGCGHAGTDAAIEAVGLPATFGICWAIVAVGGRLTNVCVDGKSVEINMDKLCDHNIFLTTTRLVDTCTTSLLLKIVESDKPINCSQTNL